jgi:cytochrome c553
MKLNRSILIATLATATAGFLLSRSFAAESPKAPKADVRRGAEIVANGTDYGVVPCARCHAFDGTADGSGAFPKLTGMSSYYLAKQLRDFASGLRTDAIMSAIARKMKIEDIAEVSEYYSGVRGTPTSAPPASPDRMALGTRLATVGDQQKEIQACEGCHGAGGRGESPAIPPLAGQYAPYIAFQMRMWQIGYRKNDANQQMANIARRLSPQDIEAIGLYFERLPLKDVAKNKRRP